MRIKLSDIQAWFISSSYPYINASPNLIVKCKCCGKRCLEIKYPYSQWGDFIPQMLEKRQRGTNAKPFLSLLDPSTVTGCYPVDTRRKLNVNKTFRRRPGHLLNVLCTFNLRPVSTG